MRNDTKHLLSSPRNAKRLLDAIRDLENGKGVERDLREGFGGF